MTSGYLFWNRLYLPPLMASTILRTLSYFLSLTKLFLFRNLDLRDLLHCPSSIGSRRLIPCLSFSQPKMKFLYLSYQMYFVDLDAYGFGSSGFWMMSPLQDFIVMIVLRLLCRGIPIRSWLGCLCGPQSMRLSHPWMPPLFCYFWLLPHESSWMRKRAFQISELVFSVLIW